MEIVRHPAAVDVVDDRAIELDAHAVANAPGLRLTDVEKRSVEELVTGLPGTTAAFVSQRAAAFAADVSGEVRRRSLAKALAVQEAVTAQLNTLLVGAVAHRDFEAVKMLDRAVSGSTTRMKLLADELRADFAGGRKPTMQVGVVATNVHVSGGR
jgi:hypothetical protein